MTPTAHNRDNRKQTSDEDSLASSQTTDGNRNHSRLGRKGDPRMARATAVRLANPNLSLIEALRLGGFDYPEDINDNHYTLDKDTVSLGQRKNQLSRRCRLAKQQANSGGTKKEGSKRRSKRSRISSEEHPELEKIVSMPNFSPERRGRKRGLPLEDDVMDEMDAQQEEELAKIARQRMAKYHPQYHPIVVPPTHISLGNVTNQTTLSSLLDSQVATTDVAPAPAWPGPSTHSTLDVFRGAGTGQTSLTSSGGSPSLSLLQSFSNHQQPHPSGVAVASLSATASSAGLTLEQLAVALSSTTNLAKVLSDQTIPEMKQDLGLNLYRAECNTLYQRCMLLAGYDLEETQETSPAYKQFAFKAWSEEGKRLEQQIGRLDPSPPLSELPESADGKIPAMNTEHSHNHEKSCCSGEDACCANDNANDGCCANNNEDRTCFDGRHVHRLEGKCGHKAIIHQPDGAPAHIDFVVNGKVECYEGIRPVGNNAALWPSRYNCEQLSCPTDSSPHQVACACENECLVKVSTDPKEFPLSDIDLDGKEWDQEFFEDNNGTENSLAGLIQLGSGSEDGKNAYM